MNRRRIARPFIQLSLLLSLAACGGDGPSGPRGSGGPDLPNGTFNGTANGSSFRATSAIITRAGDIIAMGAADTQGRALGWAFITSGPGTYTIENSIGNNASYTEGRMGWGASAATAGSGGSVTFTTLTSTRAAGSFTITLRPLTGGATGTPSVTGNFDLTIQGAN